MAVAEDSIDGRTAGMIALVAEHLEVEGEQPSPATAWPLVGPALLAHATSSLESIVFRLRPAGAHNDASACCGVSMTTSLLRLGRGRSAATSLGMAEGRP